MILAAALLAGTGLAYHAHSRALMRARTRFVANTSHELRTPLAQISMFAETLHLGRERSEAERRQFAGIVFAEARRLTALVENVLRFSRGERAAPAVRPHPHDAHDLIRSATGAFAPIAAVAKVEITADIPSNTVIVADAAAFQQIMLNLLDNAVKHGAGRRIAVSASVHEDGVHIVVDDDGPGVPEHWRARVFEPFLQVSGRNVTGAGIGLAVVRDLTRAHHGDVWLEPSPLGGARVVVSLPARSAKVSSPAEGTSRRTHRAGV
jgi:signal transduction histidine kinase